MRNIFSVCVRLIYFFQSAKPKESVETLISKKKIYPSLSSIFLQNTHNLRISTQTFYRDISYLPQQQLNNNFKKRYPIKNKI